VAVLFVLLGAPFIATLQLLIYAGAILVLFLFVIMLLNVGRDEGIASGHRAQLVTAMLGGLVFAGMLAMLLWRTAGAAGLPPLSEEMVSLTGLAQELFGEYLLPFEIVGLLLLVAVIGATVVARRPTPEELAGGAGGSGSLGALDDLEAADSTAASWAADADRAGGGARPASFPGGTGAGAASGVAARTAAPGARP
jgi:NADH-quinone oxidoreductase subunit J